MNSFEMIVRLLAAIWVYETESNPSLVLFSPDALGMAKEERNAAAYCLENEKYIRGMGKNDDGVAYDWGKSSPAITLEGLEYIASSETMKGAFKSLHEKAVAAARAKIANAIEEFAED